MAIISALGTVPACFVNLPAIATEKMTDGRVRIGAGTLYTALSTLLSKGLIENAPAPDSADARRKMYAISPKGKQVVAAERLWHYFRRPWQPDAVPQLYTDRASLKQHYQRIQRLMGVALLVNLPVSLVNVNNLLSGRAYSMTTFVRLVLALEVLLMVLLAYGCVRMNGKMKALSQCD